MHTACKQVDEFTIIMIFAFASTIIGSGHRGWACLMIACQRTATGVTYLQSFDRVDTSDESEGRKAFQYFAWDFQLTVFDHTVSR
jgi:hypothetical protein